MWEPVGLSTCYAPEQSTDQNAHGEREVTHGEAAEAHRAHIAFNQVKHRCECSQAPGDGGARPERIFASGAAH